MGNLVRKIKTGAVLTLLFSSVIFPQTVTKVLISGNGGQHDVNVQTAFEIGYSSYDGTSFTGVITRYYDSGTLKSFQYAKDNGYQLIVRSTTGLFNAISQAPKFPEVQMVMPAGSNSYIYVFSGDIETCPVIVTGAGDLSNETGYKVEFYAPDPINIEPDLSSYSNGYIAGQLAFLANSLNKSLSETRILAHHSIPGDNGPDLYDGYGQINIENISNIVLPVELKNFTVSADVNKIVLNWSTATEINNYGFEIQRSQESSAPGGRSQNENIGWEKIGFVSGSGNSTSQIEYSFEDIKPLIGKASYRLKQVDLNGTYKYSPVVEALFLPAGRQGISPADFILKQNYPNPFNPATAICYSLPVNSPVKLIVYNVLGCEVITLVNEEQSAGFYQVSFDASHLASGIYFYTITAGIPASGTGFTKTNKMTLTK